MSGPYKFPTIEPNMIGSPDMTVQIFKLYNTFAAIHESDNLKILRAGVHHITNPVTPPSSDKNVDGDDEGNVYVKDGYESDGGYNYDGPKDHDSTFDYDGPEVSTSTKLPPAVYAVACDYREQLKQVQKLSKPAFDKRMQEADSALGKQFIEATSELRKTIPNCQAENRIVLPFADRMVHQIRSVISEKAITTAVSLVELQLQTDISSSEEIILQLVSWAIGTFYEDQNTIEKAAGYLRERYLGVAIYEKLKDELKEKNRQDDLPELPADLRTGDLGVAGTDALSLPFWDEDESCNILGIAKNWGVTPHDVVVSRLAPGYKVAHGSHRDSDSIRVSILNSAVKGKFMNEIKAAFLQVVLENRAELVYTCWAVMLRDLIEVVSSEISEVQEKVLPKVVRRTVNWSRPHRQGDTGHEEVSVMSEA